MAGLLSLPLDVARDLLATPGQIMGLLGPRKGAAPSSAASAPDADAQGANAQGADAQGAALLTPPYHPVRSLILGALLPTVEARLEQNEAQKFAAERNLAIYRSLPTAEAKAAFWMDPEGYLQQWEKNVAPRTLKPGQTVVYGGPGGARYTAPQPDLGDDETPGPEAGADVGAPQAPPPPQPGGGPSVQVSPGAYARPDGAAPLSPALAALHARTAALMGVPTADQLLLQSGGDPSRYLALRTLAWRTARRNRAARPLLAGQPGAPQGAQA